MVSLPGREDYADWEARNALGSLLEAEELKLGDPKLIERIMCEIEAKRSLLDRIEEALKSGDMLDGDGEEDTEPPKSLQDFINRIKKDKSMKIKKESESPEDRRMRLENPSKKMAGGILLAKFS